MPLIRRTGLRRSVAPSAPTVTGRAAWSSRRGSARGVGRARPNGAGRRDRHDAAVRPARRLLRRRHADHHRAGRHDLLQRAAGRGAQQGRALPAGHDGAVRAAGAGGRPAARPLPARPAVRAGRHHARPGVPGLRDLRQPRRASGSTRPRSACSRCPGRTAWPARPPCPGCCPKASACPRRAPEPACTAPSPARSWRRSAWPRSGSARSGRCGSPSVIFLVGMVISLRLPPRADSDPPEAVPRPICHDLRRRPAATATGRCPAGWSSRP